MYCLQCRIRVDYYKLGKAFLEFSIPMTINVKVGRYLYGYCINRRQSLNSRVYAVSACYGETKMNPVLNQIFSDLYGNVILVRTKDANE